ncbi:MAG TPA: hypothetical protein VMC85_08015 [Desulfomonilaceae bacterium]|nr:hypothetical protein [Desulfomonilaceae bacterium]
MNSAVKLLLVATFALILVPHSFANEWLPPDIIRMLEAPAIQPDVLGTKNNPRIMLADNPADIKKSGEQRTRPMVQHQSLDEWLPLDIIRMWVFPFDP